MLITACISVFVNVLWVNGALIWVRSWLVVLKLVVCFLSMCTVLGHGHSHGGGHGHAHRGDKGRGHSRQERTHNQVKPDNRNINVRAAFIHTIGDLIQSLGVLVAAYLIKFQVSLSWWLASVTCLWSVWCPIMSLVGSHSFLNKTVCVPVFIMNWCSLVIGSSTEHGCCVCSFSRVVVANLVSGGSHMHLSLLNPRHDFHYHCSQRRYVGADGRFARPERKRETEREAERERERERETQG